MPFLRRRHNAVLAWDARRYKYTYEQVFVKKSHVLYLSNNPREKKNDEISILNIDVLYLSKFLA